MPGDDLRSNLTSITLSSCSISEATQGMHARPIRFAARKPGTLVTVAQRLTGHSTWT